MNATELSKNYGSIDLIVAAIMRQRKCTEEEAEDIYWKIYPMLDMLIDDAE